MLILTENFDLVCHILVIWIYYLNVSLEFPNSCNTDTYLTVVIWNMSLLIFKSNKNKTKSHKKKQKIWSCFFTKDHLRQQNNTNEHKACSPSIIRYVLFKITCIWHSSFFQADVQLSNIKTRNCIGYNAIAHRTRVKKIQQPFVNIENKYQVTQDKWNRFGLCYFLWLAQAMEVNVTLLLLSLMKYCKRSNAISTWKCESSNSIPKCAYFYRNNYQ